MPARPRNNRTAATRAALTLAAALTVLAAGCSSSDPATAPTPISRGDAPAAGAPAGPAAANAQRAAGMMQRERQQWGK
jgi:predicted component of type VI protein secretion system